MTPFSPSALLAILLAFYPEVSSAALARAYTERPEYFAGGALIGSKADKLKLPDARIFDLVANAGGIPGTQHWQVLDVTTQGPTPDDPFAREDGPLTFLPLETIPRVVRDNVFERLVGDGIGELGASDTVLQRAGQTIAEFDGATLVEASAALVAGPAEQAHTAIRKALDLDDPAELLGITDGQGAAATHASGQYDEDEPDDVFVPVLPKRPKDDEEGPGPPRA